MISDKHQCIFIHIPKAAGNSVENALGGLELKNGGPWNNQKHRRNDSSKAFFFDKHQRHWTWRQYKNHDPEKFLCYFKFTIIRNPFDTLVSHYFWERQGNNPLIPSHWGMGRCLMKNPLLFRHLSPSRYICDNKGQIMVDKVLRFENLEEEWKSVARRLGFQETLPRFNKSERAPYQQYYTPILRRITGFCFAKDLQRFGYSFFTTSEKKNT
jgi:hypothetical protein